MFRASSAHLQEDTVVHMQHMVPSLSMRVPGGLSVHTQAVYRQATRNSHRAVFLNRRAAARYRALAAIIRRREKPEETTICCKISLVQLITNLGVICICQHATTYT